MAFAVKEPDIPVMLEPNILFCVFPTQSNLFFLKQNTLRGKHGFRYVCQRKTLGGMHLRKAEHEVQTLIHVHLVFCTNVFEQAVGFFATIFRWPDRPMFAAPSTQTLN